MRASVISVAIGDQFPEASTTLKTLYPASKALKVGNAMQTLVSVPAIALSTLTIMELRSGWTKEQATWLLPRLYALCSIMPVTKEIAEQAGIWRQEYKSKGQQLGTPDTVIAATAYLSDFLLVTNNAKDYPMPELKLYKYTPEKAA
jgi:predicted nucleic acid-binding protein